MMIFFTFIIIYIIVRLRLSLSKSKNGRRALGDIETELIMIVFSKPMNTTPASLKIQNPHCAVGKLNMAHLD
jgi:hypothetical protein